MAMKNKYLIMIIILFTLASSLSISFSNPNTYDIVIQNGTIYNPSTNHELRDYNIGITGSKIKRISKQTLDGKKIIDASGLVVSPGFIDLDSYDPNQKGIQFKVLDGVTTNLSLHGGTEDATSWYRAWGKNGILTNYGASSFTTRTRWPIVGQGVDAEFETEEQIDELVEATRKNIEAGALAISFSLEYVPGTNRELVPLLKLAKEYNVPTFYHLRYSDKENGLKGVKEVIDLGRETGAAIHILHINSTGGTFVMDQALKMVDDARKEGIDITSDLYPYNYWATFINSARFRPGWQERFNITYTDLQICGTNTIITESTFDSYRNKSLLVAALGSMPEEEIIMLLKDPYTMIGSDGIIESSLNNHPRGAGTYSRLFGKYVREENILTIMEAIKKASYFPAQRMETSSPSMVYKGRIEIDSDADITIFNPNTIIDKATIKDNATASVGIEYVIINGEITKDPDGLVRGVHSGQPIMSYFKDKTIHNEPQDYILKVDRKRQFQFQAYELNNKLYLPLPQVMDKLNIDYKSSNNGVIKVGNKVELEIGNKNMDNIKFKEELIIYKGSIYIYEEDLQDLLKTDFKTIAKNKINKPIDIKAEKKGNSSLPLIYASSILLIIIIALIFRKKPKDD